MVAYMDIGIALRYYRRLGQLTQNQVAEKADVNEKYYGEIERNESSPTIDRLEKICKALGVEMQQVVAYKPLETVVGGEIRHTLEKRKGVEYYCNCCGTTFFTDDTNVFCPQCGCEYNEENEYIEKY